MRIFIALGLMLSATAAHAQTWEELKQEVSAYPEIRIEEAGVSGHITGILQSVEDMQLTIVQGKTNPITVPRARITRARLNKPDEIWEGIVLGLLSSAAMHLAYRDGSWTAKNTIGTYLQGAAIGGLIDWSIKGRRTLYRAP